MRLVLPLPPNKANARHHWRVALKKKKQFWDDCNNLLAMGLLPKPPRPTPQRIKIRASFYLWSYMDDDNAMARLKPALDWLKAHGYVIDDRRENIVWGSLPAQFIDRSNQRLELYVEAA